jgi:hypothetical protein
VLTHEEQRRFDDITRRIDHLAAGTETPTAAPPPLTAAIPVRLTAAGLSVVGATGVLIGLAGSDTIVLTAVGIIPSVVAVILFASAGSSGPRAAGTIRPDAGEHERGTSLLAKSWLWLTTCAEGGCSNRPVYLGWCSEHGPADDPGRDEYWGDPGSDQR